MTLSYSLTLVPLIILELATKLGVQDFEMGDAMKADGAFIGQDVSVVPLIGKLRLHIQGYVDKEEFFISSLKHEFVILGPPWFDRLAASIKFPKRKISFKFREKDMYINAQELSSTIPLVNDQAFDKSIKSSVFGCMILVKGSLNGVNERQLPPKRGDDDHTIELIPGSSPPNKPPYRVSQAQQEEIMRQVNELVEKGMSAADFCRFTSFCKMSENDGISGFVSDKLDKNNFHAWKFRMTNFLMGKGYWDYIDDATSPKQAWNRLVSVDTTNTKARKIQLKNELNSVKKENLSINDYTLKIKGIVESLASIGVQVEDDDKVEVCLRGLTPVYK
ncbi:hypothetical protein L7F22_067446 [Adiantum nelumboides]|nr:hypothetical protein [Adiantum nelumboides]